MLENLKERFGLASVWCADADGFSYRRSYTVDNNGSVDMGGLGACAVEYDGEGHEGGAAGVALQVIFVEQLPARSHVDNNVATDRRVVPVAQLLRVACAVEQAVCCIYVANA